LQKYSIQKELGDFVAICMTETEGSSRFARLNGEKYGISYLDERFDVANKTDAVKYLEPDFKIGESEGRRPALLSVCNRWYWERQKKLDDPKTFNEVLELARKWNEDHCTVLLSDDQVEYKNECAFKYSKRIKENGTMFPSQKIKHYEIILSLKPKNVQYCLVEE